MDLIDKQRVATTVTQGGNYFRATCARCRRSVPKLRGDLHRPHGDEGGSYLLCRMCGLREVPDLTREIRTMIEDRFPREVVIDGKDRSISPYPYQSLDALALANSRCYLVGNQMGTGKTPTTVLGILEAARLLGMPSIGVVPSTLKYNWAKEITRWGHAETNVTVIDAKVDFREPEPGEVLICSYGMLPGEACTDCKLEAKQLKIAKQARRAANILRGCEHYDQQIAPTPTFRQPVVLFADEAHFLQRESTIRRHLWDNLADSVFNAGGRLFGLTGTVVSNTPNDTLSIAKAFKVDAAAFDSDEDFNSHFVDWNANQKGSRSAPEGEDRQSLLEALRPIRLCRLRKHVLKHLPPVVYKDPIQVELTPKILQEIDNVVQLLLAKRRAWQEVRDDALDSPNDKGLSDDEQDRRDRMFQDRVDFYYATRPWNTDSEIQEAVNDALTSKDSAPLFTELSGLRKTLSLAKIKALQEVVDEYREQGEPLVVFCDHLAVLDKVLGGREGYAVLKGSVSPKKRQQMVDDFQSGELKHGIGVSIRAGATGITLTRSAHMIFVDWHWNPSNLRQAVDRLNRPGAEAHDSITVMRLQANHVVDRMVVTTVNEKLQLQDALEDDEASMAGLEEFAP
jgi:SNF2 family DNA or RNA helicase